MATLQKRKGKNNYEVYYPLPVKLRELLRISALNRSLGTSDKAEAKRRFPMKLVEVETEVAGLMAKHFPDDDTALEELKELVSTFKAIRAGCHTVVQNLGTLCNRISDAHGQGRNPVRPVPRHAALAVNLAGSMATFLVETWQSR